MTPNLSRNPEIDVYITTPMHLVCVTYRGQLRCFTHHGCFWSYSKCSEWFSTLLVFWEFSPKWLVQVCAWGQGATMTPAEAQCNKCQALRANVSTGQLCFQSDFWGGEHQRWSSSSNFSRDTDAFSSVVIRKFQRLSHVDLSETIYTHIILRKQTG